MVSAEAAAAAAAAGAGAAAGESGAAGLPAAGSVGFTPAAAVIAAVMAAARGSCNVGWVGPLCCLTEEGI